MPLLQLLGLVVIVVALWLAFLIWICRRLRASALSLHDPDHTPHHPNSRKQDHV